jgi:hypothetical protein
MLLFAFLLAGCAAPSAYTSRPSTPPVVQLEQLTPVMLTKTQMEYVRAGVIRSLKDPESARFGTMRGGKNSEGVITVCGYVNARNSYGGYTGEKPFLGILADKGFAVAAMGGTDDKTASVHQVCGQSGITL